MKQKSDKRGDEEKRKVPEDLKFLDGPEEKKKKSNPVPLGHRVVSWMHTAAARCMVIMIMTCAMLIGIFYIACAPKRYSVTVGSISRQTITATKDVVDTISTEDRRKAAANAVESTYRLQEGVSDQVISNLSQIFSELSKVQQYGLTLTDDDETIARTTFTESEIDYAQGLVESLNLGRYQATTLLRTSTDDFELMVTNVTRAVENALNTGIREGRVTDAITTIQQIVGYRVDISLVQNILPSVLRTALQPNLVIDQESTDAARQKAMDSVEPIIYQQGQNIIREGEVVTRSQMEMLKSLGMLEDDVFDFSSYWGAGLLIAIAMVILVLLFYVFEPQILHDQKRITVVMTVMVICMGLCALCAKLLNIYLAPVALGGILIGCLLSWRVAMPSMISMAIMVSGLAAGGSTNTLVEMLYMLLMSLVSFGIAAAFLKDKFNRFRILICGILVGLGNALMVFCMGLLTSNNMDLSIINSAWTVAGGIISGLIVIGLQAILETVFNLATPSKLLEIGNPNHPLLKRLMLEAPGTYHHSIVVANLSEAAADEIHANALLARTAAYFHDVGKLKRPSYFKENQQGINPLDMTDPYVSAAIVTTHTRDGVKLAQKYHLPMEIQDIIMQHHGDTPVMFFYHRALQQSDGKPVDIADFRYDGVRPTTKEAAIIMLADTVEAAVRSMKEKTPEAIASFIEQLVRGKLEDGQLSDCPLTFKDIDGICKAFETVLSGVFHERIQYPKTEAPKRTMAQARESQRNREEKEKQEAQVAEESAEKKPAPQAEKPQLPEETPAEISQAPDEPSAEKVAAVEELPENAGAEEQHTEPAREDVPKEEQDDPSVGSAHDNG
ncbi:MAG: HDIG domain-containing protein [Clostridia bacterium]|nr:HDIG domain-containing protein [Clostridia bacterium]